MNFESWGRYPRPLAQRVEVVSWRDQPLPDTGNYLLPRGMGRSYGDSCLNDGHVLLYTRAINRLLAFDRDTGVLRCEAGLTLAELLAVSVPAGWFVPVTPGTRFVTIGGAIANDVHGKNHDTAASFGNHVRELELLRSDGQRLVCSLTQHPDLFRATIGGLGLTGLITVAEIQLKRISNPFIDAETLRFNGLDEFLELTRASRSGWEYTVSWVDTLARGNALGRGLFTRGNSAGREHDGRKRPSRMQWVAPPWFPSFMLNALTVRAFNRLYYRRQRSDRITGVVDYEPFFYPLDAILGWNRMYGTRGFLQYQCVVPPEHGAGAIRLLLAEIARSGAASFLSVLKAFGDRPSIGMLSFPRPGITLALDFRNRGATTLALMDRLDAIVFEAGGALYPAKDARMTPAAFRRSFPDWEQFARHVDPAFSSGFWRRVTLE